MMLTFIADATVRSSALIAVVWLVLKLCRTRDPVAEKLAWTVVLAATLVMPLLTGSIVARALPALEIVPGKVSASMGHLVQAPAATHSLSSVILTTYFLGVAILASRLVAGLFVGARLRREARRTWAYGSDLDVRLSAKLQGPVSFGSTVLLPVDSMIWDRRTVRAVLAHEREHIRNHDGYRLWLALLCRAVFWFNPCVHWLYRRLTVLTELTSDAAAVAAMGDRASYMNVLLQLAAEESAVQMAVPMARRSTLPVRVRALLPGNGRFVPLSSPRKASLAAVVTIFGLMIAACSSEQPPRVQSATVMATVIYSPELKNFYPDAARHHYEEGTGIVKICINKRGTVTFAGVQSSTGNALLDSAMVRLADAYRFKPATRAGRPVRVCTGLPVRFKLACRKGFPCKPPAPQT